MSDEICGQCGVANPVWTAPSPVWNLAVGGPDAKDDPGGVLCPVCFIERAEGAGIVPHLWEVSPAPSPKAVTVEQAARVLMGAVAKNSPDVVGPYFCATENYVGRHSVDAFLRAIAGDTP